VSEFSLRQVQVSTPASSQPEAPSAAESLRCKCKTVVYLYATAFLFNSANGDR